MTGEQFILFSSKQSLGLAELQDHLYDATHEKVRKAIWASYPSDAWLARKPSISSVSGDLLRLTSNRIGTDGNGELVVTGGDEAHTSSFSFPNALGVDYHVGLKVIRVPATVARSKITGAVSYTSVVEHLGYAAPADDVTVDEGAGTITFDLGTAAAAAGGTLTGRLAIVYCGTPRSIDAATAIVSGTIDFTELTIGTLMGQTSPSTDPADYMICILGPVVSTSDLSTEDAVLYVGTVTGAGPGVPPTVFDTSEAVVALGQLPDIYEIGPNGDYKILVTAHEDDADDVPQITVTNQTGNDVFTVDAQGNVNARSLTVEETIHASGGTSDPTISATGDISASGTLHGSRLLVGRPLADGFTDGDSAAEVHGRFRVGADVWQFNEDGTATNANGINFFSDGTMEAEAATFNADMQAARVLAPVINDDDAVWNVDVDGNANLNDLDINSVALQAGNGIDSLGNATLRSVNAPGVRRIVAATFTYEDLAGMSAGKSITDFFPAGACVLHDAFAQIVTPFAVGGVDVSTEAMFGYGIFPGALLQVIDLFDMTLSPPTAPGFRGLDAAEKGTSVSDKNDTTIFISSVHGRSLKMAVSCGVDMSTLDSGEIVVYVELTTLPASYLEA